MPTCIVKEGYISTFIPLKVKKRSENGQQILAPRGQTLYERNPNIDPTLYKALIRAHLWQRQLNKGKYANMIELADAYKVCRKYAITIFRLNFLPPLLKEAILNGTQPQDLTTKKLTHPPTLSWEELEKQWDMKLIPSD